MNASIKDENQNKVLQIDIKEIVEPTHGYCIYRVPENIRKIKEEAYTPQLVSIGPLHHGNAKLAEMEKKKPTYMESFRERITIKMEEILTFIGENEQRIRNFYAEVSTLESCEYIKMIMNDAVFIIELFWRCYTADKGDDLLRNIPSMEYTVRLDLQLLENQLPYFVLEELYKLAFVPENPSFMDLSFKFLGHNLLNSSPSSHVAVKHFTDLRRIVLLTSYPSMKSNGNNEDLPCAVKLRESGVAFRSIERKSLLDIRFKKGKLIPFFSFHDKMQIPRLEIYDETECLFRNIMALEQCHYSFDTKICNYVDLIDRLINTEKDVDLLVGKGIISNYLGDSAAVANMFNKLGSQICLSNSCYYNLCKDLKAHYNNPWNKTKANLRRVYFSNLWRGTATVAAVILVLLTIIQTICSIMDVV